MTQSNYQYGLYKNISASGLVYTGPACLQGVVINSNSSGTLKLEDAITDTTPIIFNTFTFAAGSGYINLFGAKTLIGIYAVIGGTADVTIIYTPYKG